MGRVSWVWSIWNPADGTSHCNIKWPKMPHRPQRGDERIKPVLTGTQKLCWHTPGQLLQTLLRTTVNFSTTHTHKHKHKHRDSSFLLLSRVERNSVTKGNDLQQNWRLLLKQTFFLFFRVYTKAKTGNIKRKKKERLIAVNMAFSFIAHKW